MEWLGEYLEYVLLACLVVVVGYIISGKLGGRELQAENDKLVKENQHLTVQIKVLVNHIRQCTLKEHINQTWPFGKANQRWKWL